MDLGISGLWQSLGTLRVWKLHQSSVDVHGPRHFSRTTQGFGTMLTINTPKQTSNMLFEETLLGGVGRVFDNLLEVDASSKNPKTCETVDG